MSCEHCTMTISDGRYTGASYEIRTGNWAFIEYDDGDYDLTIEEWTWNGNYTWLYVPITHCPWCGRELE